MEDRHETAARNLGGILTRNAEEIPDRTAVIDRATCLAWSVIDERTNRLANTLAARGVNKGDRVAFLLHNDHTWLETTFAALKLGAAGVDL